MAVNSAPIVKASATLDCSVNNPKSIIYTIQGQTEAILGAQAEIYQISDGAKICTYTNNGVPTETSEGYLFPIYITEGSDHVSWASGHSISDWTNQKEYFIKIKVESASGWSQYSSGQPFWCIVSPTVTFASISNPLLTTNVTPTVTINMHQSSAGNVVEKYQFIVVNNATQEIYKSTDWLYDSGTSTGSDTYRFTHMFDELENGSVYRIYFIAETSKGTKIQANSNIFQVSTGYTLAGSVVAENRCDDGKIGVTFDGSSYQSINFVVLERKENGQNEWVRLYEQYVPNINSIHFTYNDYYARYGAEYTYRVVPIYREGNFDTRGDAIVGAQIIESTFSQVYIADRFAQYAFISDVSYGSLATNQQTGTHTPLGATYPIITRNANTNYQSGSFSGRILPVDYESRRKIMDKADRLSMTELRNNIEHFLTNGAPKILKDWNGNIWLIEIVDNVDVSFDSNSNMSAPVISANWIEIGSVYDEDALAKAGLTNLRG